jgi:transcriptional regulator with XRE-family HTH domain
MLNNEAFDQWRWQLGLSDQEKAVITHIRTSLPARRVRSSTGNVSWTYPSLKMGFAIQFESHKNELPFAYLIDHDPDVLELYSQPAGEIKLKYRSQDDTRDVTARHTPDFFVLHEESAGWVECKREKDLAKLAKKMPFRYQQRPDGSWYCPPGEAYAAQFGLTYRVFSSAEIDWTYIENLRFLAWRSRPGFCTFCAWPLFVLQAREQGSIDPETPEFVWQQWVTEILGAVVAHLPTVRGSPSERIRRAINHTVERRAGGNIAVFSHLLDLSRNTVENWCQGKRISEMDMLLRLCYRLNLSLDEVLFQEAETLQPYLQDPILEAHFHSWKRTTIDKERIFHLLEEVAGSAEDPPLSLQEVGQRLGYQPTTLYKINRVACHTIAERFTTYRRELREKRLQGYREEIQQIALYLRAEQVTLTQRHIGRYLAQPAILRDPKVSELLREVCHKIETSSGEKS